MIRYFWRSDDEQLAGQFVDSHFDEDGSWWASVQQSGAVVALATLLTLTTASTALASQVFNQAQDDPHLVSSQSADEVYWLNPVPPVVWPQTSVFVDDDAHPTFVQSFAPDDGDWRALVSVDPGGNYVRLPFLDPEDFPQFPTTTPVVDEADFSVPLFPQPDPDWNVLFFLDDGSWVPAFQPDEDLLPSQALPAPQNWPQPAQAFFDTDDTVPEFVAEDVVWLQLVAPVQDSLVWPQPWLFEQNESTNLVAFTAEEHNWPIPVPVPDSIWLLRQDAFEQTDATGSLTLTLDDSFQPLVIPGIPTPILRDLRLLQQWPFEQNEPAGNLRNNVDEDYWLNWTQPVVWPQTAALTQDEILGFAPSTVREEDFWTWLVMPVPATLSGLYGQLLYLPDVEEIPAGSLVPFVPPTPPFCPLPPAGPDSDISMSIFSNFRGGATLALFCRICNSGKPLVVRADYAIWCQDCCAFVSKQDTYMGTVQAPGAFRSRF